MSESARDIAMIFQNYALYPHLSVYHNIGFPLKLARVPKRERDTRVREVAETLGLTPYLESKPGQLSGGQRQRVAMGRAIVRQPQVFLMDEPLSNLDAKLRAEMRTELLELQRRLGTTMIYVTHDQAEAMTLGDRVAVLNNGSLMQVGTPDEIYARPDDLFVAGCLGSPTINTLRRSAGEHRRAGSTCSTATSSCSSTSRSYAATGSSPARIRTSSSASGPEALRPRRRGASAPDGAGAGR